MTAEKTTKAESTLVKLIAKATRRRNVELDPACTFKDLGVDSLQVVHIMVALEDALDIEIVDADLKDIKNMGAFVEYLNRKVIEKSESDRTNGHRKA